jgi:hypothetical protein
MSGDLYRANQEAVDVLDGDNARLLLGWLVGAVWRDQLLQERLAVHLWQMGPATTRRMRARTLLRQPAERLAMVLDGVDARTRAAVLDQLRHDMATAHPDLYRVNDDGGVDYIGPRAG